MRWYWFKTYLRWIVLSVYWSMRNRWSSKSKSLVVVSHVGLGDQILLAGLIKHHLSLGKSINWFVRESNVDTIRHLTNYHPKLQIQSIPDSSSASDARQLAQTFSAVQKLPLLVIGFEILWLAEKLFPARGLDEIFYIIGGVSFPKSIFESSRELTQSEQPTKPYALVDHFPGTKREIPATVFETITRRGFEIKFNPRDKSILSLIDLIKGASEIHVVNSALLCLIISLRNEITSANVYLMGPNVLTGKSEYPLEWREFSLTAANGEPLSIPDERDRATELALLLSSERKFKRRFLAKILFVVQPW